MRARHLSLALSPAALAAIALLASSGAQALVMEGLSNRALTQRADAVVRAVVIDRATRDVPGRGYWTDFTLRVLETLKGEPRPGQLIAVGQFGGTLNGRSQRIPGDAVLQDGEEVVVFLSKTGDGFALSAFSQSKLHVERDPIAGAKTVARDLGSTTLVGREGAQAPLPSGTGSVDFDDFRAEILSYVADGR